MPDILDRIDAAVGCQQCGGPLDGSPSGDFCTEDCQDIWHAGQVGALVTCQQVEAVTSLVAACEDLHRRLVEAAPGIVAALRPIVEAFASMGEEMARRNKPVGVDDSMARALQARRNANTGPTQRHRPPRRIDARGAVHRR